jgi:hypothetical protein
MGPQIQWVESYVTGDKIYCVYIAQNEDLVRQHAQQTGFPANKISAVVAILIPIMLWSKSLAIQKPIAL